MTIRCAVYLRISLDQNGDGLAIDRQRDACRKIAKERGWQIVAEYVDPSNTASDKRRDRPGYNDLVSGYEAGQFTAIVCYDLDRLTRQPRQLEDWIDAAEERGLLLVTANGEADLSTDNGRLFARIKAAVARAEIERKSARQRAAAVQRAELGKPPLGTRAMGYTPKGQLISGEADTVKEMFDRFVAGDSLRGITAWLHESGVPTRRGGRWNLSAVHDILSNPRYAARSVYNRHAGGSESKPGTWSPIVDDDVFDTVQAKLSDPRRRSQVGTDRKYLGSGLYLCGVCNTALGSHSTARYRCRQGGHLARLAAPIYHLVVKVLRARLAQPDAADLLTPPDTAEAKALSATITKLRARLVTIESDYDGGLIDGKRYKVATAKATVELQAAEAARLRTTANAGVSVTLLHPDPVAAFDAAPLGAQREILGFLVTVRVMPAPRGAHFDPESVEFDWHS
jgi:site-specific DNA recombinase